jgi:hypothetical protein
MNDAEGHHPQIKARRSRVPTMKSIVAMALALLGLAVGGATVAAFGRSDSPGTTKKKVLVELYTSQGCDSCPAASDLLGRLAELGFGPDRIVPVNFHVEYFNQPWVDPFSDAEYSRRQWSYNAVQGRNDLYFTPMMMVDGRTALLGSNRTAAVVAIKKGLKESPGVTLKLTLDGTAASKLLTVEMGSLATAAVGRELLVGAAVVEDQVTTRVLSGENAGKTLVEPFTVRSFAHKFTRLERTVPKTLTFPLSLTNDAIAGRSRVSVFVQDRADGRVHQAETVPWVEAGRVP